jgi:hypothetical protein
MRYLVDSGACFVVCVLFWHSYYSTSTKHKKPKNTHTQSPCVSSKVGRNAESGKFTETEKFSEQAMKIFKFIINTFFLPHADKHAYIIPYLKRHELILAKSRLHTKQSDDQNFKHPNHSSTCRQVLVSNQLVTCNLQQENLANEVA